jgi:hypothetical protein
MNAPVALDAALLQHTKTHQPAQATTHGRRSCQIEKQQPLGRQRMPHVFLLSNLCGKNRIQRRCDEFQDCLLKFLDFSETLKYFYNLKM